MELINSIIQSGSNRTGITNIFYKNQLHPSDNSITSASNNFFINIGKELSESFSGQSNGNGHLQFLQNLTTLIPSFFLPLQTRI